jgi:hypothetical protein
MKSALTLYVAAGVISLFLWMDISFPNPAMLYQLRRLSEAIFENKHPGFPSTLLYKVSIELERILTKDRF